MDDPYYYVPPTDEPPRVISEKISYFSQRTVYWKFYYDSLTDDSVITTHLWRGWGKKRTVIFFPILGGANRVAKIFAYLFRIAGFNTVIIERPPHPERSAQDIEDALRQNVLNTLQVLYWLPGQHHIDYHPQRTAMLGVSLGGINIANMTAFSDFPAYVMIMAGADIPNLIMESVEFEKWLVENVDKNPSIHRDQFLIAMKKVVKTDPINLAQKGERVFQIQSGLWVKDKSVPVHYQRILYNKFRHQPRRTRLPVGHYSMIYLFPHVFLISWLFIHRRTKI